MLALTWTENIVLNTETRNRNSSPIARINLSNSYVNVLEDITFDGSNSDPGNGTIINYTWNLDYGTIKYSEIVTHNYTNSGKYKITLTITTNGSKVSSNWTWIIVDNTTPIAAIIFQDYTGATLPSEPGIDAIGEECSNDSDFIVTFNASKSTDTIDGITESDIAHYFWNFGDNTGRTAGLKVAKYHYNDPGTYLVTLNVTDAAGNYNVTNKRIKILDFEPPIPNMITDPPGKTCPIDKSIILNGTMSKDNSIRWATWKEIMDILTFKWDLDLTKDTDLDGIPYNDEDALGAIVNFTPKNTGLIQIVLNVSDPSGNWANSLELPYVDWVIEVLGADLRFAPAIVDNDKFITIDNQKPKKGETVEFTVNITNDGMVSARNIVVALIIDNTEEDKVYIDLLEENDFEIIKFSWEATEVGKQNLTFNISFESKEDYKYETDWDNNELSFPIDVFPESKKDEKDKEGESLWLYLVIVVVIIIIIVLIIILAARHGK